jgi:small subunit ribosomal protein S17
MPEQQQTVQQPGQADHPEGRGRRRALVGVVTSDKMNKTRRVEIPRLVKHVRYGKYIRRRTICHVHDEKNESHEGDTVEIMESRPLSKTKHWRLVRILTRAPTAAPAAPEQTVPAGERTKVE